MDASTFTLIKAIEHYYYISKSLLVIPISLLVWSTLREHQPPTHVNYVGVIKPRVLIRVAIYHSQIKLHLQIKLTEK